MTSVDLFRQFVAEMDGMLRTHESEDGRTQRELLNELFKAERVFKKILLSSPGGKKVYSDFIIFILEDKSNLLSVRVYFRERQDAFAAKIFVAFRNKAPSRLYRYRINYLFAAWALKRYKGPHRKQLSKALKMIGTLRKHLCENNLPLAINRAKMFWSRAPHANLEYMDLIQASSEGLINAIDKFVPPYKTVFRTTAIGRMTLNMQTDISATMVKIPLKEQRILYRVNKAKKNESLSRDQIVKYVQESFKDANDTIIQGLESVANHTSSLDIEDESGIAMRDKISSSASVEAEVETKRMRARMDAALQSLSVLERKIILLKYGDLYGLF